MGAIDVGAMIDAIQKFRDFEKKSTQGLFGLLAARRATP
jgi:hypothetical protein